MSENAAPPPVNSLDAFLRPESMVTPGALGALTLLITNALLGNFQMLSHGYTALALSFVLGLTAILKASSIVQKFLFYVINSLIIFSVAAGTNVVGVAATTPDKPAAQASNMGLISSAYAATSAQEPSVSAQVSRVQFFQPWFQEPASPANSAPIVITQSEIGSGWSVIVGSFSSLPEAKQRSIEINAKFGSKYHAAISFSPVRRLYAVTAGSGNLSFSQATDIQHAAIGDGLSSSAYLKRTALLQPVQ